MQRFASALRLLPCAVAAVALGGAWTAPARASRLDEIEKAHELRVCAWPRRGGVMYRDSRSGEMRGMDADLARELAHDLGVSLHFVEMDWRNLSEHLEHDRCDVAMGSIGVSPELSPHVRFTKPYLRSDHYMVVSAYTNVKSWNDLDRPGVAVGVRARSSLETIARHRLRKARIVLITEPYSPDGELEAGRIDAYLATFSMARYAASHFQGVRVIAPDKPFEVTAYAYAAKPGDDAWVARLDAFVEAIKHDGRLESAAHRWGYDDLITKS